MRKKILIGVLVFLVVIQFIRPARNISNEATPNEIGLKYTVPDEVRAILKHSCYDCHSNNTKYPWYADVQPVGWWLQWNISDGKEHLNFSEFSTYTVKKARHRFEDIEDAATNGWMPLSSYTWLHEGTKLNPEQAKILATWAAGLK